MCKKILVIRLGSLGDVILTSAATTNLKLAFPDSELTFLTRARYSDLVRSFWGVDRVVAVPDHPGIGEYSRLLLELDHRNFDVVVDLHGNLRSWLARKIIGADKKIVYPKRRFERQLIVRRKRIPDSWPHTIDLYNECLGQLGVRAFCKRPQLLLPSTDTPPVGRGRQAVPVVAVASGAAHPNKQWDPARFYQVARNLNQRCGARIKWVIAGSDGTQTAGLSGIPDDQIDMFVDSPLGEVTSALAGANLTLANDSGIGHLSSAVGTPVISVFGPTHPSLGFAPRGLFDRLIEVDEFCRPCSLHGKKPCYREQRYCFTRISADEVTAVAEEMLKVHRDFSPALIVDRDGTIMVEKEYLSDPDEVELEDGAVDALRTARDSGYKLVIVSNQSGVARGYFGTDNVDRVNKRLLELLSGQGVAIDGVYYCPHNAEKAKIAAFKADCDCRKPAAGMAEQAARELRIDLRRSAVIGDSMVDYNLGKVIGGRSLLVRTGYGAGTERRSAPSGALDAGTVFDNLSAAVRCVVEDKSYA